MNWTLRGLTLGMLLSINAWAGVVDDMKVLVQQGKADEAYQLGKGHPEELGDPAYDFYFGVAAVSSGRSGEGVLALERYVLNFPENPYGRLELARGYFVLGEDSRARQEFALVLDAKPPEDMRVSVERFLDALRSREATYNPVRGFYVEAGFGYDSNANAGVASGSSFRIFGVDLPVPAGLVRQHDTYKTLAAGANGSLPLAPGLILFGGINADLREYSTQTDFNQKSVSGNAGLTFIKGKNLWRGSVAYSNLWLQNDDYRHVWTVNGEWYHQLDERQTLNAFIQHSELSYTGTNSALDSRFPIVGVGYRRAFIIPMQPLLSLTAYGGKEDVSARSDRTREVYGARITGSLTPAPRWSVLVGATLQQSDYAEPDLTRMLDFARHDQYTAYDLTVSYAISRNLSVRGEGVISRNSSNDNLFQYERNSLAVKIRYDFK
ncbi:MAG: hypothetical protein ABIS45_00345 [Burkholderiales bacterium]